MRSWMLTAAIVALAGFANAQESRKEADKITYPLSIAVMDAMKDARATPIVAKPALVTPAKNEPASNLKSGAIDPLALSSAPAEEEQAKPKTNFSLFENRESVFDKFNPASQAAWKAAKQRRKAMRHLLKHPTKTAARLLMNKIPFKARFEHWIEGQIDRLSFVESSSFSMTSKMESIRNIWTGQRRIAPAFYVKCKIRISPNVSFGGLL